ncbi:MAG: GtrA family protein [Deltaproteobacteria bacterium]|nr:GtrA family protein [Deltaproteobacteria bacterium]
MELGTKYALFSFFAIAINIGSQDISLRVYNQLYAVQVSIFIGTITGLVVKYILDKKYIFFYQTKNMKHDSYLFMLYSSMGVITTMIFWGVEWMFELVFQDQLMRYLGGVIGLCIGYTLKYFLDKRFVFKELV